MTVMTVLFWKSYGEMITCMGRGVYTTQRAPESFLKKYSHYGHYSQVRKICPKQLGKGGIGEINVVKTDCNNSRLQSG